MIIHIDMDAFYASVEQRDNPGFAGLPIVVGGTPQQRGVVAAASYEARKFGIRSAMPSSTAIKLCPEVVFVPMRMKHYTNISKQIREIFLRYTPLVEPLSLDEAFLDVEGSTHLFGDAGEIAASIKDDIRKELGLTASVGIAPNKFVAKIASDLEKPNGFVKIDPPLKLFLDPLDVNKLWGIGKSTENKLKAIGIHTIREFRHSDPDVLRPCVGSSLEHLLQLANGEDDRKVVPHRPAVTMSRETTFARDIDDIETLEISLLALTEQLAARLRKKNLSARTIGIKLRYSNFKTITRSQTQPTSTNGTQEIWKTARRLLRTALGENFKIRLVGIQTSSLEDTPSSENTLFEYPEVERQKKIDRVVDDLNQRFGDQAIRRGGNRP